LSFVLHPDLQRDGIAVGRFSLCQLLLINDQAYPWFVLVPERENIRDTIDLSPADYLTLWSESRVLGQGIMQAFAGEKLNVAALGNVTPQLHIHHVVRYASDPAWPAPIWGKHPLTPYDENGIRQMMDKLVGAKIAGLVDVRSY
jgi:diadenosine tetraphosphate (Ap4A) HIT family hydrolase